MAETQASLWCDAPLWVTVEILLESSCWRQVLCRLGVGGRGGWSVACSRSPELLQHRSVCLMQEDQWCSFSSHSTNDSTEWSRTEHRGRRSLRLASSLVPCVVQKGKVAEVGQSCSAVQQEPRVLQFVLRRFWPEGTEQEHRRSLMLSLSLCRCFAGVVPAKRSPKLVVSTMSLTLFCVYAYHPKLLT